MTVSRYYGQLEVPPIPVMFGRLRTTQFDGCGQNLYADATIPRNGQERGMYPGSNIPGFPFESHYATIDGIKNENGKDHGFS